LYNNQKAKKGFLMTEQFIITSNDQQTQLNVRHWPCPSPKAVVQLIHGMAEHIQRYDEFARFLNQLGFAVIGHDHLGHGESVQPSAPIYGFFGEQGPENVVTDIHQVKQWAVNRYPQLPYFMMGHSMGSFALRNYLQDYPVTVQGVIFMGTGTSPLPLTAALPFIKKMAEKQPKKPAPFIDKLAFGSFSKKFPEASSFNWLSKNQANVADYENDPLMGFVFTNNGFATLFSLVKRANQKNWYQAIPKELPILIISGAEDPVGDFSKGPAKIQKQLKHAGFQHVTLRLFPTLRHEILLETEKATVFQEIGHWLTDLTN